MNVPKWRGKVRFPSKLHRGIKRGCAIILSAAMILGSVSSLSVPVYAAEEESLQQETNSTGETTGTNETVSSEEEASSKETASSEEMTGTDEATSSEEAASPEETGEPEETASSEEAASPEETGEPEETASSEEAASPEETGEPEETASSEEVTSPEETGEDEETTSSEETSSSEETASPEETGEPKETTSSEETTSAKETTGTGEETKAPEATGTRKPVKAPVRSLRAATGNYSFGTGNTGSSNVYNETAGYGFSDVSFPNAAAGWQGGVYVPREEAKAESASYVTDGSGYVAIGSKVWTETEETGYGVYTYENTSTFDLKLDNANYTVSVTFVNPTNAAYTASLEAEDITKVSGIAVEPNATVTKSFTACLIDGVLNIKMLETSTATSVTKEADAQVKNVYVSAISVAKQADKVAGSKPTVYIASDSTVQTYESNYYPQTGWGQTLYNFFEGADEVNIYDDMNRYSYSQCEIYETPKVVVENRAIGGRSSYSFVAEGKLDEILDDIKPGDYLLIQWGHNDATTSRPNRYVSTDDFESVIQIYIDAVKQRGATPILVTPVARYSYTTNDDGTLKSFASNFEGYRQVMIKMAQEQSIPIVDLTQRSIDLCNEYGIEGAKSLFLHLNKGDYPDGAYAGGAADSTHLQYYGAYKFAQCVAQGIKDISSAELAPLQALIPDIKIPENVPSAPTDLKTTDVGASSVSITWTASDTAELYYIYRKELADGESPDSVDFTNAEKYSVSSTIRYTDSNCVGGKTYVYAVAGFNPKGVGEKSEKISVTTKSALYKYDFCQTASDPTLDGWLQVTCTQMYDKSAGYGWITAPGNGRYRSGNGNADSNAMTDDFCLGVGEFAVDLPNGRYEIKITACDLLPGTSTIKPAYTAEGVSAGSISCKQSAGTCSAIVTITDGQLNVGVGGTNQYINGLEITPLVLAPENFLYQELTIDGDQANFLLNWNNVDNAVSYKVYVKGTQDTAYRVLKTVTQQEKNDATTMPFQADPGETYQYYVTAVFADGSETTPSNTLTIPMIVEGPKPAAPTGVTVTNSASANMQLSWNAVDGAIKYYIYRSDRAEGTKGFYAYEKIGEVKGAAAYTDNDPDATANVAWYYKVVALGKTGLSEMSEAAASSVTATLTRQPAEKLTDRALVAVDLAGNKGAEVRKTAGDTGIFLSWRLFEGETGTTFTIYKNGTALVNDYTKTNYIDLTGTAADTYKVVGSTDGALNLNAIDTNVWGSQYLELTLDKPADQTMPDGTVCTYASNDMSVGDLDGDGQYELIVKWYPSNAKDNSGGGYTGTTILDAYDINMATGTVTKLWRIDLGINIRSGAHYTQFQVWDMDGDGKAEILCKTADGTIDGTGTVIGDATKDYRNTGGYILDGPEFLTVFNGQTGAVIDTVDYVPARGSVGAWGDAYGNRVDRFLSAIAYLDGVHPYAVFCRGYYTRTCLTAYKYENGKLSVYWTFDTDTYTGKYSDKELTAQGNHGLSVNDIDNDGKDEIIYGSLTIDHNGTVKYSTELGHGDAMHVSDWLPQNPGLEIMQVHEHDNVPYHVEIHDAETGEILVGYHTGRDTGRGVAADIDPTSVGAEWWSIASPSYVPDGDNDEPSWDSTKGEVYAASSTLQNLVRLANCTPASNFSIFWDGDLLSEIQDHKFNEKEGYVPIGVVLSKWDYENEKQEQLLYSEEIWSINGTKGNVGLVADICGDWREEIIARSSTDDSKIRIYTTTIDTEYSVPTLMDNDAYRIGVAWQNVGYNQPANLSYLLSEGLVTAQLSEGEITKNSAQVVFTEASDGTYGHEITAYEIYRAEGDGEYTKIATVNKEDLVKYEGSVTNPDDGTTTEPEKPKDEILWEEDFEGGMHKFTPITAGADTQGEDPASTNKHEGNVYYIGAAGGGRATQNAEALGVSKNVTVELDIRIDGCGASNKAGTSESSNFSLLGAKESKNWLTSDQQILTICATNNQYTNTASGNGVIDVLTINGQDIMSVKLNSTAESRDGKRQTTGWLRLKAELDFTTHKVNVSLVRMSDSTEVYTGELDFVNTEVNSLEYILLNGGKGAGGIFTDNMKIYVPAKVETPDPDDTGNDTVEYEEKELWSEDFEGDTHKFTEPNGCDTHGEDQAQLNKHGGKIYKVTGANGGRAAQNTEALGINKNVTVEFDLRMDGCAAADSSNFALLGEKDTKTWLSTDKQILTITAKNAEAKGGNNRLVSTVTINGEDITASAKGQKTEGYDARDESTGWLKVKAELNFETHKVKVLITRMSDNSEVYNKEVDFVNKEVNSLEYIIINGGKVCGGVSVDNMRIYELVEKQPEPEQPDNPAASDAYVYTDTGLTSGKAYTYKIAAVVDGKTSHMSRPCTIETLVDIKSVKDFELENLVEDTPLEAGKTAASLLPKTVTVIDQTDSEVEVAVTWDVSNLDITTPGTYTVTANVRGWDTPIEKSVTVIANVMTGYEEFETVKTIIGVDPVLPEKAVMTFLNGTTKEEKITWDTSAFDKNTLGEYTLTGTTSGGNQVTVKVNVVENYIVSVIKSAMEVSYGAKEYSTPATVTAVYADGTQKQVPVTWENFTVDTDTLGETTVTGTVGGFDGEVLMTVYVEYPAVYKFDFGIEGSPVADGWIGINVNPKSGKKTVAQLGVDYTAERGYGFAKADAVFEGRSEAFVYEGKLPQAAYNDFAIPDGNTFKVNVENGKYIVEVVSNSMYKSTVKVAVQGGSTTSISNAANTYTIQAFEIEVTDGVITLDFAAGATSRMGAVIVRKMEKVQEPEEPTEEPSEEEPSSETPTEPSSETPTEPSSETPTEPSSEAPTEPSSEAPTEPSSEEPTEAASDSESSASSETYKAEIGAVSEEVLNDTVKEKTNCNTLDELINFLKTVVTENSDAQGILPGVAADNTVVIDVQIVISNDGGNTWIKSDDIPSAGVDVIIPYPESTNKDDFDFVVGHLITKDHNGQTAGTMEYLNPVKTEHGLQIHIYSASPFVVGWKAIVNRNTTDSVKTGDTLARTIPVIIVVMVISAAAAAFAFYDRKRRVGKK